MADQTSVGENGSNGLHRLNPQESHFNSARQSLKQALSRYAQKVRLPRRGSTAVELQSSLKKDMDRLSATLDKLDHTLLRVAVFGLVSRGKSAVINALLGQKVLQTGPLHGVTQYPRSVYWKPATADGTMQVELIDTPGLDEVGGQTRADMAREMADQADLILFVVAGDMTRTEYNALEDLQRSRKPLILVFNKTDLYPDQDRFTIYRKLQNTLGDVGLGPFLSPDDIVMVAAEPAPVQVRVEYPDGKTAYEWETLPPQIDELEDRLLEIFCQEGKSLLALNALRQARDTEENMARKTIRLHKAEAEELIWKFAQWKAIAVGFNPIAFLDVLGGAVTDLILIRSLANLYGLPMTSYEAGKLLNTILLSSGGLLLGEIGSGALLGVGKSAAAAATAVDVINGFMSYTTAAVGQAALAGYGSYRVGKAAQAYLERGCAWGPQGPNTVIQEILDSVDADTVLHRLRRELGEL